MSEIQELWDDIQANPDKINEMSVEDIVKLQNHADPFTTDIPAGPKQYVNLSILNWRDEYLKRLLATSLIGFVYRQLEEYEPLKDGDIAETLEESRADGLAAYHKETAIEAAPTSVVSAGKAEATSDDELAEIDVTSAKAVATKAAAAADASVKAKSPYVKDTGMNADETATKSDMIKQHVKDFLDSIFEFNPDRHVRGSFDAVDKTKDNWALDLRKQMQTTLGVETQAAVNVEPAADIFHNWSRYRDNHYEEFVTAVGALYLERPDHEHAIVIYDSFDNATDADDHIKLHHDNIQLPIYTIESGAWTYLSSRKENREVTSYDNRDTELLRRMTEKAQQDQSLGKDMMLKRVKSEKKKNVLREGPDGEGLDKYKGAVSTIATLGGKEGLSKEERDKLHEAYYEKEMAEVPDDALQVDVWGADKDGTVKKKHFYTEAEAPTYLNEAKQGGNVLATGPDARVVTSRDGTKKTIGELKQD